jgi:sulfur carrier protein
VTGAIVVVLNGEDRSLPDGATVADLVASLDRGPAGIAVARNGEVVPRSTWPQARLADGDHVEVLTAAQGG